MVSIWAYGQALILLNWILQKSLVKCIGEGFVIIVLLCFWERFM